MLRTALRCEQGTCNEAVEIDMGMLKLSQRIEKEALLLYGKMAFIPGKHNDILEIAWDLDTRTVQTWEEILEKYNITSFRMQPITELKVWRDLVI